MKAYLYKIECLTNLHVGSEGNAFAIIDKEAEKDINGDPIIHASGIKGALRDCLKDHGRVNELFGQPAKSGETAGKGKLSFLDARILGRPLRCCGGFRSSVPVTTIEMIEDFLKTSSAFCCNPYEGKQLGISERQFDPKNEFLCSVKDLLVEGEKTGLLDENEILKGLLGDAYAVAKSFESYDLPAIARNNVSLSRNLWYEEYVPHGSIFYTIVVSEDGTDIMTLIGADKPIQLGGNASVGYGFVRMSKIGEGEL